jgi:hypothetical protein
MRALLSQKPAWSRAEFGLTFGTGLTIYTSARHFRFIRTHRRAILGVTCGTARIDPFSRPTWSPSITKGPTMREYVVFDANPSSRLVALMDASGRHHVAHCTADLPPIDHKLHGAAAVPGFALMLGAQGMVYRLIFTQLDCGEQAAFDLVRRPTGPAWLSARPGHAGVGVGHDPGDGPPGARDLAV